MKLLLRRRLPFDLTNSNDGRTKHWYSSAKFRNDAEAVLRIGQLGQSQPFDIPVAVEVMRVLGPRQRLWDYSSGLRGNWKEIEDALVGVGWFVDDGPKYIKRVWFSQDSSRREDGPCVVVSVYEWGDNNVLD